MKHSYFFHYTNKRALSSIFDDASRDNGLQPSVRFINLDHGKNLPSKAHAGAIWGMLSPRPKGMLENDWGTERGLLRGFLQRARDRFEPTYLVRAYIDPQDDIYIADFGPHLDDAFRGTAMKDKSIVYQTKRAYWDSLVPLRDYDETMNYTVPEVICFNAIPKDRLEIVDAIPASEMERYIDTGTYDPAALERDRIHKQEVEKRRSESFIKMLDM